MLLIWRTSANGRPTSVRVASFLYFFRLSGDVFRHARLGYDKNRVHKTHFDRIPTVPIFSARPVCQRHNLLTSRYTGTTVDTNLANIQKLPRMCIVILM